MTVTAQQVRVMLKKLPPQKRAELIALASSYQAFRLTYFNDAAGFVKNCVKWGKGEHATEYQVTICNELVSSKRYCVRGPHGLGKTAIAALVILWFALTRDVDQDWKVPCTASVWRQLTKFLWPEVHKWARKLDWEKIGRPPFEKGKEMQETGLKLKTGEAFALAAGDPSAIEGAHADCILYVFDEAKTIDVGTWDAAEGALSTGDAMAFAISTPGEPMGRFYEIQSRKPGLEDWATRHITLEDAILAGRIAREWADARKRQWGENSAVYQNRVEGNFAASDEDGIIPLLYVERAIQRWHDRDDAGEWGKLTRVGADIGRGGDPTVLSRLHGLALKSFEETHDRTVMPVTGRIKGILEAHPQAEAVVDVIGIGAGVVDRLREFKNIMGRVIAFNAAGRCDAKDKTNEFGFVNQRAWAWWTVRELLQDDLIDLPPNDEMIGELTAPKYEMKSGGRIQVEDKDKLRELLGRSTNYADAVIQAFWKKTGGPSLDSIKVYGGGEEPDEDAIPEDIKAYLQGSEV